MGLLSSLIALIPWWYVVVVSVLCGILYQTQVLGLLLIAVVFVTAMMTYGVHWCLKPLRTAMKSRQSKDFDDENYYLTEDGQRRPFHRLDMEASVDLTLVVPAYNEEERLPIMLDDTMRYLTEREKKNNEFSYEIIVVDDGSKDQTAEVVMRYVRRWGCERIRLCKLRLNCGKGGAVRKGMMRASGRLILMVDADGATKIDDLTKLETQLRETSVNGRGLAIGSRAHMDGENLAERTVFRRFLMQGFRLFSSTVCGGHNIKDTQCGFKLFTRGAAALIFPNLHIERWAFDVEMVYLAVRKAIPMIEVPVRWQEIEGSKVDSLRDSLQMARDVLLIRLCYMLGVWKDDARPYGSARA